MHGTDDPIIPLINARILAWLIRRARLHIIDDGHLFLISRANDVAPIVRQFLADADADADSDATGIISVAG
jgi:pimeloyl-ACP methyl ester carboxylesterase